MKAIVYTKYGPPKVLQLQDVPKLVPKDKEVLIRVRATTVTTSGGFMRRGEPIFARPFVGLTKPRIPIPGTGLAGNVVAVGKNVTRFAVGDAVVGATDTAFGTFAEYARLPEDGALVRKPVNMSDEEAEAICEGALTALPFLRDYAKIQPGQHVLINGASGAIGTFAVQLSKHFGAEVTGVCSGVNVELVQSLGADMVIDYTKEDFAQSADAYEIIFDTVGKRSFSQCKNALKPGGVYLSPVLSIGTLWAMLWKSRFGTKRAIFAASGLRPASDKAKDLHFLKDLIEAGKLRSIVDRCYPLEEAVEASRYVDQGHKKGNVVLRSSQTSLDRPVEPGHVVGEEKGYAGVAPGTVGGRSMGLFGQRAQFDAVARQLVVHGAPGNPERLGGFGRAVVVEA